MPNKDLYLVFRVDPNLSSRHECLHFAKVVFIVFKVERGPQKISSAFDWKFFTASNTALLSS